ncbi:uncharacterized protein LRATD2 isoform X2 [Felis catus]|uniref:uncharacterized protein LRATD2 isoform X2 n=1 Tax=Felis catus TaxID=9685 RepID=UPI001D1A15EA|nr:uncharacterized protein LRATD2 isoform X2 [Felis catus]
MGHDVTGQRIIVSDVASGRGSSVRRQSVPDVGRRLTGLAAGDPEYLLLSIKQGKGPPHMSKRGWMLSNSSQLSVSFSPAWRQVSRQSPVTKGSHRLLARLPEELVFQHQRLKLVH